MKTNEKYFEKTTSNFYDPMTNRYTGYIVTEEMARQLAERLEGKDPKCSSIPDEDIYNIFVGVNIWCNLFTDLTAMDSSFLMNRIMLTGLQNSIAEADNHRLWLVSEGRVGEESPFWSQFINQDNIFGQSVTKKYFSHQRYGRLLSNALSLLGCLRRIRLSCLDYSFMIEEFLVSNRKCGYFNQKSWIDFGDLTDDELSYFRSCGSMIPSERPTKAEFEADYPSCSSRILDDLAEIVAIILADYKRDLNLFTLPPGSTYEGAKTYIDKFKIVEAECEWLAEHGIDIRDYCHSDKKRPPANFNRYITVPKSYKTGRGVAPEPVSRQVLGYQIASGIEKCLKKFGVNLHDQGLNQEACRLAVKNGLTTVDYSAASDSISLALVEHLFKYRPDILADLKACRTEYISIRGRGSYVNHRAFTMGNAVTFSVESLIFLALAIYSVSWHGLERFIDSALSGLPVEERRYYSYFPVKKVVESSGIRVYGDDVILPDYAYATYCDLSQKLGFTVNAEKSYTGKSAYRESCGVEYWQKPTWRESVEITGVYYPRGTSRKALPELLGLQHKYWSFPSVNNFLLGLILDVFPGMTASEVSDDQNAFDLWVDARTCHRVTGFSDRYLRTWRVYDVTYDYTVKGYHKITKTHFEQDMLCEKTCVMSDLFDRSSDISLILERIYGNVAEVGGYDLRNPVVIRADDMRLDITAEREEEIVAKYGSEFLGEVHAVVDSRPSRRKIPEGEADRVERLMYLLTLGKGIEHINSSDYTEPEDMVRDRRDLLGSRKILVTLKTTM